MKISTLANFQFSVFPGFPFRNAQIKYNCFKNAIPQAVKEAHCLFIFNKLAGACLK